MPKIIDNSFSKEFSWDTRKDPHRIHHWIPRPLVSGTQRVLQSNRTGPETALIREAENPAWDQGQKSLPVPASTGVAWARSLQTHARYPQDAPQDLKTSAVWNTAAAPIQSCGT